MNEKIKSWLVPFVIASLLFVAVRPTLAQISQRQAVFLDYLASNNVEVGEETKDGFMRVYYLFEGKKNYVSPEGQNSRHANSKGEYIVWAGDVNGAGQIYLYHIPTKTTLQITNSGTNLKPKVSRKGEIVWEKWIEDRWQLFLFDGKSTQQLTSGDVSVNANIEGDNIVYARQDVDGNWRAIVYSISSQETREIATGIAAKHPAFENGNITLNGVEDEKKEGPSLAAEVTSSPELPLPTQEPTPEEEPIVVTEEEIRQELEATPSAEASPAAELDNEL